MFLSKLTIIRNKKGEGEEEERQTINAEDLLRYADTDILASANNPSPIIFALMYI
jgi:hypothetical protein